MGKKNKSKRPKVESQPPKLSFRQEVLNGWKDRNPILKFVLGFAVLMIIFYSFWFTDLFTNNVLNPVVNGSARVAGTILNLFGYDVNIGGPKIYSNDFSISIEKGCDALEPIAIYLFAVLLFPTALKNKWRGIAFGIPLLLVVNQVRIISLYLIGVYGKPIMGDSFIFLFDIMHMQVWQVLFILITLLVLAYWIIWSLRRERQTAA